MKRSIVTIMILGLLPGCAAVQLPHHSPSPGRRAGLPIRPAEIMEDTSEIFDVVTNTDEAIAPPMAAGMLRLELSLAVGDVPRAIDDIVALVSAHNGYVTDSDTGFLGLSVPTGNLKAVLAGIGSLGDIIELVYGGADLRGADDIGHSGESVTTGDLIYELLTRSSGLVISETTRDRTTRLIETIRNTATPDPGRLCYTAIDVTLLATKPHRPGVGDCVRFFVKEIGGLLKR